MMNAADERAASFVAVGVIERCEARRNIIDVHAICAARNNGAAQARAGKKGANVAVIRLAQQRCARSRALCRRYRR